jgi:hypothetical protein
MQKLILSISFLIAFLTIGNSQNNGIHETEDVSRLMQLFIEHNKANKEIDGWRIQIATTTDRRQMDQARSRFSAKHPDIPITWKHVSPYYHVKVGAYETKLELQSFLNKLKKDFPSAIAVRDKIEETDLL